MEELASMLMKDDCVWAYWVGGDEWRVTGLGPEVGPQDFSTLGLLVSQCFSLFSFSICCVILTLS